MLRNKTISGIATAMIGASLILAGCGGGADQAQTKAKPAAEAEAKPQAATAQKAAAYPIDFCVVSGEKLGAMGDPVEYKIGDRTIKLCCNGCVKKVEANPAMYLAKLDSAAAAGQRGATGHEGHNH